MSTIPYLDVELNTDQFTVSENAAYPRFMNTLISAESPATVITYKHTHISLPNFFQYTYCQDDSYSNKQNSKQHLDQVIKRAHAM